jgi:hypothetical protein
MRKLLLVLIALVAAQLCATSVIPMSVEQMATAATHVVRAQAISSRAQWNAEHTQIFTFTRFQSLEALKGATGAEFVVRQMGGRVGNIEQKVSGVRRWQGGEEAVLFLRPSEVGGGVFAVVGLFQGNFAVTRAAGAEATVSNGVVDAMQYDPATRTSQQFRSARISLSELRQRVALARGR